MSFTDLNTARSSKSITGRAGKLNKFALYDLGGAGNAPPSNIFEAAERGNSNFIVKLMERSLDIDVNIRDKLQRTALHWAAEMGHISTVEVLIDFGGDVTLQECNGRTAVHLAARGCDAAMLKALLAEVDDVEKVRLVNQGDMYGITPVFLAVQKADDGMEAFEVLMSYGGRFNEMQVHVTTPVNK